MFYTYNSIVMKMVRTNNIQFDSVFSDDGVDYLYTHYIIDINAIVNPTTMAYTGGPGDGDPVDTPGTFPATTVKAIRHALLQPRKKLVIADELGNELLATPADDPLTGGSLTTDARTGPLPSSCAIMNISGARTVMVRWQCEGWIIECPDDEPHYIISNRWMDQMDIDEFQMARRTCVGRTIFNKALMERDGFIPDDFRNYPIFPGVHADFQRKRVSVVQNSEGTQLDWQVEDHELIWNLGETSTDIGPRGDRGSGILEISGTQALIAFKVPGNTPAAIIGSSINQIQLRAIGSYFANQWNMIERLISIVVDTLTPPLMAGGVPLERAYFMMDASIQRSLGQKNRWVELNVAILCPQPETVTGAAVNLNVTPIYLDIKDCIKKIIPQNGVNPQLVKDNASRGSSIVKLITQGLTRSCQDYPTLPTIDFLVNYGPSQSNNQTNEQKPNDPTKEILQSTPSKYDQQSIGQYPYTIYNIDVTYKTKSGIKQIPTTGSVQDQSASDPTCGLVQVHMPISRVRYLGMAERIGAFPVLPNPVANNTDEFVLLDWHLSPMYAVPSYDGVTPVYRCDFYYEYAITVALDQTFPIVKLGKLPFSLFGFEEPGGDEIFSNQILGI